MSKHRGFVLTAVISWALLTALAGGAVAAEKAKVRVDGPDGDASLIGAVRLKPQLSYTGVSELLEKVIKEKDEAAWGEIQKKIDYTYKGLKHALGAVLLKGNLQDQILVEIKGGKKLLFKPNLVVPRTLDLAGDGSPGAKASVYACTDWAFVAALMRYFHDDLGVRYYQMALGEAGTLMPAYSLLLKCTPEAIVEGCGFPLSDGKRFHAGWCMNWIRKYLSDSTVAYDSKDDPKNGYEDSLKGNYVTPGQATQQGKLMVYDLNNAEWFDRGRRVEVPDGGDNYKEGIVLHKAIVGDPADPENYPGCILVNVPIWKVHALTILTNAIKNLGIGGWPMCAGSDSDVKTTDWLYSYPPAYPPGLKGGVPGWSGGPPWKGKGVYHDIYYVVEADDEAMPLQVSEEPNMGLDGTMVDINLAIKGQVSHILHVVDGVNVIDIEHGSGGLGVARQEGLIVASTDPVAIDLFCARYMFKNAPISSNPSLPFARTVPLPRYDKASRAIVTGKGLDCRVARSLLFDYAAARGLGKLTYYIEGRDETIPTPCALASKDGHFGRIQGEQFCEILTNHLYFHRTNILWDLQPSILAYAQATDQLAGSRYYGEFMALDEDRNGVIDDRERGSKGMVDCSVGILGVGCSMIGRGETERGAFFMSSRLVKYADPAWNRGGVDTTKVSMNARAFLWALRMANNKEVKGKDSFFGIPYGTEGGTSRWPSLQFARYTMELALIDSMYSIATAYSKKTGNAFKLYVPKTVPYAPLPPAGQLPWGYNPKGMPNVVKLDPTHPDFPRLVFTAEFSESW